MCNFRNNVIHLCHNGAMLDCKKSYSAPLGLSWISTRPFNSRNRNRKWNEKIRFHFIGLSGKEKTFCKQAITLTIKHFYDR